MALNDYITKTNEVTSRSAGIPIADRTQQMDYGMGLAQRMAQQAQQPPEPPPRLVPIVPVAN